MSRRHRAKKRELVVDKRYNNVLITMFINVIMKDGKKTVARNIVYDALEIAEKELNENGCDIFLQALNNVSPTVELRSSRHGGVNYQIPTPIKGNRSYAIGMRWLIDASGKIARGGISFAKALSIALIEAYAKKGTAVKRNEDNYKMAESNRAFSHFRFFGNRNRTAGAAAA